MSALRFPNPIFVALDTPDLGQAQAIAKAVGPYVGGLKVGLEFISAQGPQGVAKIIELGRPVFVDVKFHDIPNTVAGAAKALARLGAAIFNVHTSGGEEMMRAAVEAAHSVDPKVQVLQAGWLKKKAEIFGGKYHIPDSEDPEIVRHYNWYEATGFVVPYPGEKTVRPASDFHKRARTKADLDD